VQGHSTEAEETLEGVISLTAAYRQRPNCRRKTACKVSRTSVRKAIQNLIERGLAEVKRGKGTFVTQPKIT
jgi:GntR family transcriptional regulator